jgi:uncharacterized protein (DUF58 family)
VLTRWRRSLEARFRAAVRRRQGPDLLPLTLQRRRIYILPTRAGLAFTGLLFLMLLAGLNYGNSLALFLTFLLAGFALVGMQLCHRNLLGAALLDARAAPVFAGTPGTLQLTLGNTATQPRLQLEGAADAAAAATDVGASAEQRLYLPLAPRSRGVWDLERMKLATAHPFGLFRAWTWVHTPLRLLVYPQPRGSLPMPASPGRRPGQHAEGSSGADEWLTLRPFREGDSPRQVDWKAYAREAPLLVKEYAPPGSQPRIFEYERLSDADPEARLSQLARWIVDAEARDEPYGLILPGLRIPPDHGPEQRHRCLAALATFALPEPRRV